MSSAAFADDRFSLRVFERGCIVETKNREITLGGKEPQALAQIVILHYLAGRSTVTPAGRLASYRDMPHGQVYYPGFKKKIIDPIAELFQLRPQLLVSAGIKLGGKRMELGSASVQVRPLPRIPVTVITWKSDKEVHGSANMLFDETAAHILPPEDLAEVGWFVQSELRKSASSVSGQVMDRNEI